MSNGSNRLLDPIRGQSHKLLLACRDKHLQDCGRLEKVRRNQERSDTWAVLTTTTHRFSTPAKLPAFAGRRKAHF
jgi:hypothetical protein